MHGVYVKIRCPETVGIRWHDMPVVTRLVIDKFRSMTRRIDDVAEWIVGKRQPADEMWIRLERIVVVVEKDTNRCAGENNHVGGTSPLEGRIVA